MNHSAAFPSLALLAQKFPAEELGDVAAAAREAVASLGMERQVRPGQSVAISAGSRGVDRIAEALAGLCGFFRGLGAEPFVFPAMGSHGGATAEGQRAVLAAMGVTEEAVDAPIRSSMDVVEVGRGEMAEPVYIDALAAAADHIVAVNRVKAHTKFKGRLESGLAKMLAVGMAKHAGAAAAHQLAVAQGFPAVIESAANTVLQRCPVLCGVALVENAFGRAHTLRAMAADEMLIAEAALLEQAKALAAKLPFDDIDLLIVDEIGKDVSGTGMDTNVTGRNRDILGDFSTVPRIKRIFVRGLTAATGGNALGIGYADFTTDRLVADMDYHKTVTNALTGISPEKAAVPVHFATDRDAVAAALSSIGPWDPATVRVVRIHSTARLTRLFASSGLLGELPDHCQQLCVPRPPVFDAAGNLLTFPA